MYGKAYSIYLEYVSAIYQNQRIYPLLFHAMQCGRIS